MNTEHILAMKSEDGKILLFDEDDKFKASYSDGKWIGDLVFNYSDLQDNFRHLNDDDEIVRLLAEAKVALGHPTKQAKAG